MYVNMNKCISLLRYMYSLDIFEHSKCIYYFRLKYQYIHNIYLSLEKLATNQVIKIWKCAHISKFIMNEYFIKTHSHHHKR